MASTVLCGLLSIGFTFNILQVAYLWKDSGTVGIMLGVLTIILGIQWMKYEKLEKGSKK